MVYIEPTARDSILDILKRSGSWDGRSVYRRKDEGRVTVESSMTLLRGEDGNPRAVLGIHTDISQRLALEEQVRQSQRLEAVGQLTGGVAHDFNNLLTIILGNSEIFVEQLAADSRLRPLAEATLAAAERGSDLVSRLLSFARQQPLDPKPTDINKLVSRLSGMLRRTLGEQIVLDFVRDEALWQAEVDAPQLENAILNLCLNARDAMPKGGRLTIETTNIQLDKSYADQNVDVKPGAYVMIAVSDTGVGMPPEVVARAFDPFFTTKDVGKGTGLGLSMVFGFAKQSNGHVAIYSEEGQGTTVKLYLPRAEGDSPHTVKQTRVSALPRGTESILLVEDNDLVRNHIAALLESLGYNIIAAQNGIEAIDVLTGTSAIDLLFTDVVMPGPVNGRELTNRAKQLRPDLPVLFTSGYTENVLMHHGRLDPGTQLLGKPFRIGDLARKIREVLEPDKAQAEE